MDSDVIALLGGLLFLLLALVGGGFTIKEISMPMIPAGARAACLVVGVVLVVLSFMTSLVTDPAPSASGDPTTGITSTPSEPGPEPTPSSPGGSEGAVLWEALDPKVAAEDGIELSGLRATGPADPVPVGDQILVEYTLTNVGSSPVTFNFTFTGVRAPGDRWADAPEENTGAVIQPGAAVSSSQSILLDDAGSWKIWPCYELRTADGSPSECPDEWNRFFVTAAR